MIKGVVFDCFGVLSRGSLDYFADLVTSGNRQEMRDLSRQADYGFISHDEHVQNVSEITGLTVDEVKRVFQTEHVLNRPLMEFVKSLRFNYKTAMLSNVGHGVIDKMFTADELSDLFDDVVLSADFGIVKPAAEIYELSASRLGLLTNQCVMIDDIPRNIDGAKRAGMQGVLFTSNRQLQSDLKSLLGDGSA